MPEGDSDFVNWLFLDLNSFFASCEQQERPELRGRPVIVVPMATDSTCAIAASYEAKAFGIKTGTPVWEAKKLCPGLVAVQARQRLYLDYHHRVLAAVETCLHVTKSLSIDEMACRLMGSEREAGQAEVLALRVKRAIREKVGARMTCSIGLAPSVFLGKVASDMRKPDGLVVVRKRDLPEILYPLDLRDLYGIGRRMEQRLHQFGIGSVRQLMQVPRARLRRIWGGVHGVLYYELLHGADFQFPSSQEIRSISHQHVLEPELRTLRGAQEFSRHLASKAAERLRRKGYYCRRLGLGISAEKRTWEPAGEGESWWNETGFRETQGTEFLLERLGALWRECPKGWRPKAVWVILSGLVPAERHQPDLFAQEDPATQRRERISPLLDALNDRYGRGTIAFGAPPASARRFSGHAAFARVPEEFEF